MKSGQGFLLVFSLTSQASLRELTELRDQLIRIKDDATVPIVLVGNKSDLAENIAVTRERVHQASHGWGSTPYYETSARRRVNVDEAFRDLVRQIMIQERQAEKAYAAQEKARVGTGFGNGSIGGYPTSGAPNGYDDNRPQQYEKPGRRRRLLGDHKCVIL